MKERLNLTNNEKMAREIVGLESNASHFAMAQSLDEMVEKERAEQFNGQVDKYVEKLNQRTELLEQYTEAVRNDLNACEIKPMMSRVLVEPCKVNPFQKMITSKSGLIIDAGGYVPEVKSSDTGEWEELEQAIEVGLVVEVGPDCKYTKPGDYAFYQKAAAVPVPFFKLGFKTIGETQIISIVNEGLTERFNKVK